MTQYACLQCTFRTMSRNSFTLHTQNHRDQWRSSYSRQHRKSKLKVDCCKIDGSYEIMRHNVFLLFFGRFTKWNVSASFVGRDFRSNQNFGVMLITTTAVSVRHEFIHPSPTTLPAIIPTQQMWDKTITSFFIYLQLF